MCQLFLTLFVWPAPRTPQGHWAQQRQPTNYQQWVSFGLFFLAHDVLLFISICVCEWGEGPSMVRVDFSSEFTHQPTEVSESLLFFFASSFIRLYLRPSHPDHFPASWHIKKLAIGCSWQVDVKCHRCPEPGECQENWNWNWGARTHKHNKVLFTPLPVEVDPPRGVHYGQLAAADHKTGQLSQDKSCFLGCVQLMKLVWSRWRAAS